MPFGRIRQPVQALPLALPLPLPHNDVDYLDQRFQAYYYTPDGVEQIICVEWNTRQHRAIFIDGNQQSFTIDVRREYQVTLAEVLELHGIVIHEIELQDMRGQNIPDAQAMLNQSVEDMPLLAGSIWSPPAAPIEQALYQPELYAAG
jgi:hypothetical protein